MEISNYVFVSELSATELSANDIFLVSHSDDNVNYVSRKVSYDSLSNAFSRNIHDYVSSMVSSYDTDIDTLKTNVNIISADQCLVISGLVSLMECSKKVRSTISSHNEQLSALSDLISIDELSISHIDAKFSELKSMAYCVSSDFLSCDDRVIPGMYNAVSVDNNGLVIDALNKPYALSIALTQISDVTNLVLLGEDDQIIATCDATELIKDSFLKSVEYKNGYLIFTFNKGTTRKPITETLSVSLSNLVDIYTPGLGLTANSENPKTFDVDFNAVSTNINLSNYTLTSENEKWDSTYFTVSTLSDMWNIEQTLSDGEQLDHGLYSVTTNKYGQITNGTSVTSADLEELGMATKQDLDKTILSAGYELQDLKLYKLQSNKYGQVISGELVSKADFDDFGFADNADLNTISTDVKSIQTQLNDLQNTMNTIQMSIQSLNEKIEPLYELSDTKTDVTAFTNLFMFVSQLSTVVNDLMSPTMLITEQQSDE